ncbi:MAG: Coenzyme F420 hydrogenase/dehydrogenase, beta subunit C-terminal domain [Endomicrobiaceae bacterium]
MILIKNKQDCTGCCACKNICPEDAIDMIQDGEGFLYPRVNKKYCKNCGLCERICPVINTKTSTLVLRTYAAKNKNFEILKRSSSGGIFSVFAESVLKRGGVVFGAAYTCNWEVYHTFVDNIAQLDKLRRSKYVQSNVCEIYNKTKEFLDEGRPVLFSGTPCHIAGLKNFLQKDYKGLITADIFCHGVASPKVWKMFLEENTNIKNITAVNFRDKSFGWDKSILKIYFKNKNDSIPKLPFIFRLTPYNIKQKLYCGRYLLSYMKGFLKNLFLRPSCHKCKFKGGEKNSDFTIGDLWGVDDIFPDFYDKNGVSVLTVNSLQGQRIFEDIKYKLVFKEISLNKVIDYNRAFAASVIPNPKREEFFMRFQRESLNSLINELIGEMPLIKLIFGKILKKITGLKVKSL